MGRDDDVESKLGFPFIRTAPRAQKPRSIALTILADRGLGSYRVADIIETAGDHIDFFKFGIGAWRVMREDVLRRKIAMLKDVGIRVLIAGDASEAAFMQGVSRQFYDAVKDLGADAVEVSSAQVTMGLDDKCALIAMAKDCGLMVVGEAGQKGHSDWTRSQSYVLHQIEAFRNAGAWKVLVQAEGISEDVGENRWDLVLAIVARFGLGDIIFQAKDSAAQEWYIGTFGNKVNLDVDDHQALDLEVLRRGIRKRHIFGLVGSLDSAAAKEDLL